MYYQQPPGPVKPVKDFTWQLLYHPPENQDIYGRVFTAAAGPSSIAPGIGGILRSFDGASYISASVTGINTATFTSLVVFTVSSVGVYTTLSQSAFDNLSGNQSDGSQQIRITDTGGVDLIRDNQVAVLTSAGGFISANKLHCAVVSWNHATGAGYIAVDGRVIVSASPGAQAWATGGSFALGRKRTLDLVETAANNQYLYARSDAYMESYIGAELSANPWQIFEDPNDDVWTSVAGDVTLALTGQSLTVTRGSLTASVAPSISGQASSISQGTILTALAHSLTGQATTLAQGTLQASVAAAVLGQATALSQGIIVGAVSPSLTGQSASLAQGTVLTALSQGLSGQAASIAQGSVQAAVSAALSGQATSIGLGSITIAGLEVAITGQALVVGQGSVSPTVSSLLTGHSILTSQGVVVGSAAQSALLSGNSLALAQGTVSGLVAPPLTGQPITVGQGTVTPPAAVVTLTSADLTAIADAVWSKALETITAEQMMRVMLAALAGKREGLGTATEMYMARNGTTPRITLTPDASGNGTPTVNGV